MLGIIKKAVSYFNNLRIRKKLLSIYLVAGVFPLLCLGIFLIINTSNLVYQQHVTQIQEENKRVKIIIFDATYLATNISDIIFYDDNLKSLISTEYTDESEMYEAYRNYTLPSIFLSNYSELSGITIYVNNKSMISTGQFQVADKDIKKTDWYQPAAASNGEIIWIINSSSKQDGYLWLVRKIPTSNTGDFAVLVISVSNNFLNLMVEDSPLHTVAELNGDKIFYSDNYDEIGNHLITDKKWTYTIPPQLGVIKYGSKNMLASSSVLKTVNSSNNFQIVTIDSNALKTTSEITLVLLFVVFVSLLLPCIMILIFSNIFSKRIITLRREMHKIAGGDFRIIEEFNGNDELGEYFSDMKLMIESIKNLYAEIYNEKLSKEKLLNEQQKMKLEMLTSQINPHFLFNTLETIRMKAFSNGEREVAQIIKLLGKSMRHVLEVKDGLVTLESELDYIRNYIDIQTFRFGDKINYEINVAKNVGPDSYFILPLLIQPVVENAIVHGLEDKEADGWVKISIEKPQSILLIVVSDNGVGMGEEQRQELLDSINTSSSKSSIGLHNVQQRIKLFYGQQYGIGIKSRKGEGTFVTISLPSDGRETVEDESFDH